MLHAILHTFSFTFVPTLIEESMEQKEKRLYNPSRNKILSYIFVQFGLR